LTFYPKYLFNYHSKSRGKNGKNERFLHLKRFGLESCTVEQKMNNQCFKEGRGKKPGVASTSTHQWVLPSGIEDYGLKF